MELLALGAGVYLAHDLFQAPLTQLEKTRAEELATIIERPYELNLHEMRHLGAIMPKFGATRARVPWNPAFPPYYIAPDIEHGPHDSPTERTYTLLANAQEHERLDTMEEAARGRRHFIRKTHQPLWNAFSRELVVHDPDPAVAPRTTNRLGFQWMPTNPTDSDWNEAGLIGKALPPNPTLFTPDSVHMTAPGMPFRHGAGTVV